MQRDLHHRTRRHARALVVNDDSAISLLLALVAEELELVPLVAHTHKEASRLLLEGPPFAVVITASLAHASTPWSWLDALQTRQETLATTRGIPPAPVMLVSAHNPTMFDGYEDHGVTDVIPAPFELGEFTTRLQRLLA